MGQEPPVLVVNTGSTSTKCALFFPADGGVAQLAGQAFEHADDWLGGFAGIADQADEREALVRSFLDRSLPEGAGISAVGAIGGMLPPVPSGVIAVNRALADYSLHTPVYAHASNLAAPIARRIAADFGVPALAVDPVGVDEMAPVARLSGSPLFPRFSYVHALNIRACVHRFARENGRCFADVRAVVCHLGGGFSIAPVVGGRIVDSDNRMEAAPFTPERAGGVPPIPLLEECFAGRHTREELLRALYGRGGLYAYLGTRDVREASRRAADGDGRARLVLEAMAYQVCKEIGAMASVLDFDLHAVILTGGVARDPWLSEQVARRCARLGRIVRYPGENENEAIAAAVWRVLQGHEEALAWPECRLGPDRLDPFHNLS